MGRDENLQVARDLVDAFDRSDYARMDALTADDVVWHEIGSSSPIGKAELRAMGGGASDYEVTVKTHDIVASDDHVIVLTEATATRAGKSMTYRTAEIYHVSNGQVSERWAFSDDTAAISTFFA